ncbi:Fic/DOC family protein [Microvirga puerhi]|uniref:protein adenylyltransferase n=1 Tax=Microvirga puerhi TaxID=2876078 RepID=A0ABS7VV11_9HYPH|nr:Fic family protein [Microvirga puerhi]MBZ6078885.1 Fic family protein [Microvirga puerhi]
MSLDPFGDYESRGYLRNSAGSKDPAEIKLLEREAFRANVESALAALKDKPQITYQDVLDTHRRLFSSVYPWAGQDRTQTAPDVAISKGGRNDLFAHPAEIRRAAEYGLAQGQDRSAMRANPGEVFGTLAHAHPFLEGNGRTILVVHSELARRAGLHIDWSATKQEEFLKALTNELDRPGKGLDPYLKPFVRNQALDLKEAANHLQAINAGRTAGRQHLVAPMILPDRPELEGRARFEHQEAQARAKIGIPLPSPALREALASPADERGARLADESMRREFRGLDVALSRRLTNADQRAIASDQLETLSQSLGIKLEAAHEVAILVKQVNAGRVALRAIEQARERTRSEPSIGR